MKGLTVVEGSSLVRMTQYLINQGIEVMPLLWDAGFSADDAVDPSRFHPLYKVLDYYLAASQAVHDPTLGLSIAGVSSSEDYGLIGYLFRSEPTIDAALDSLQTFATELLDSIKVRVLRDPSQTRVQWLLDEPDPGLNLFAQELVAIVWQAVCHATDVTGLPLAVRFRQGEVAPDVFARHFGIPATFGANVDEIVLDPRMLARPNPTADARLLKHLVEAVETQIAKRRTVAGQTAEILRLNGCTVNLRHGLVTRGTETITLTTKERALLDYFAARANEVVSHHELERDVWRIGRTVVSHAPAVAIRRLRQKIEPDANPVNLLTVFGQGWKLVVPDQDPPKPSKS